MFPHKSHYNSFEYGKRLLTSGDATPSSPTTTCVPHAQSTVH